MGRPSIRNNKHKNKRIGGQICIDCDLFIVTELMISIIGMKFKRLKKISTTRSNSFQSLLNLYKVILK